MATVWSLLDDSCDGASLEYGESLPVDEYSWVIPLRALLLDSGVLRDLLGELNHGPSGKIGKDNRLVSGKVLTAVRQEVLAVARQRTATEHPPTRVLLFLLRQWLFLWDPYTNLY